MGGTLYRMKQTRTCWLGEWTSCSNVIVEEGLLLIATGRTKYPPGWQTNRALVYRWRELAHPRFGTCWIPFEWLERVS